MTNILIRHSPYLILALGFCCSLLFAAEFDLVAAATGAAEPRHQRVELEEMVILSGLFSLALAALAFFKTHLAALERRRRSEVEHAAYVDPLTGLSNRRKFLERLEIALARRHKSGGCALLLLDLDGFKQVNDSFGHAAGDALLVEVAARLTSLASTPANAARLGGDEFALIIDGPEAEQAAARALVKRLHAQFARPINYERRLLQPSGSVGLAFASDGTFDPALLLEAADVAMYRDKRERKRRSAA
jgi:diguanylate cyclase (GGDEF)-like protein